MAFVFLLFLTNGVVFLAADLGNARRLSQVRLNGTSTIVEHEAREALQGRKPNFPPRLESRVRIIDAEGNTLYAGNVLRDSPTPSAGGFSTITVEDEDYSVLTVPLKDGEKLIGYAQVSGVERLILRELPVRALLYFIVSLGISLLTFGVGLFFARRSLKPAEEMMERLHQFTQDASHELRTPITAISTSIDLALMTKDNAEYLRSAKKELGEMTLLVERLLELARLDAFILKEEPIAMNTLILDVTTKLSSIAEEKKISIKTNLAEDIDIMGDPLLVRQVVSNVIMNAIKFNIDGGTVTIILTHDQLVVRDTGKGIDAESLPHIFDRFYQEDSARSDSSHGVGLGLALVKRIVDLHHWTIAVESTKDVGTTVIIHF